MTGEFDFIRDLPDYTFYDNIISIIRIKEFIDYVNLSYKHFEELQKIKDEDIFDINIYYDFEYFDYEDKYII